MATLFHQTLLALCLTSVFSLPSDQKLPNQKLSDKKVPDQNPSDQKLPNRELSDKKVPDQNLSGQNLFEQNLSAQKPSSQEQSVQKPSEKDPIECPKSLCDGYKDGYYAHADSVHHFVRCVKGYAFCQQCSPASYEYSVRCNQCLFKKNEDGCDGENQSLRLIVSNFFCPDACSEREDNNLTGMVADPYSKRQFVACWKGKTIGCLSCPRDLIYNEEENECLFEGGFRSEGENDYIDWLASF